VSIIGVLAVITLDFYTHVRRPHRPSAKEAGLWIGIYVTLAVLFGIGMGFVWDWDHAGQYFAGFVTEESLSFDNLFIFLLIMTKFAVPPEAEQKVLLIGIIIALVLRAAFILAGAAVISHFSWVFYIFGAFLLFTAVKMLLGKDDPEEEYKENAAVRLMRRFVHTAPGYSHDRFRVVIDGRHAFTPLVMVVFAIGTTDILFALDSIPAIFGLTKVSYIVFMANAFALLGLRQLYFLIGALMSKLKYLSQGLSLILAFIGVKLVLEALHANQLPFINGGRPVPVPEIGIGWSLGVVVGILAVTVIASLIATRGGRGTGSGQPAGEGRAA
jgi:tellurite resistance protein TerC